jgi:hypothetical protein
MELCAALFFAISILLPGLGARLSAKLPGCLAASIGRAKPNKTRRINKDLKPAARLDVVARQPVTHSQKGSHSRLAAAR